MMKKAVVFAYHDMGVTGLNALKRADFDIRAIYTYPDPPKERGWFASVAEWGKENGIDVFMPENIGKKPDWIEKIRESQPDVIFSFYYRELLTDEILSIAPGQAYNLHGSLLPAYRGRAPINWVIVNGEKETGVTLHHMVTKADAGDVVGQKKVKIDFEDTAHSLFHKLLKAADELLGEVIPMIREGRAPRFRQDLTKGSYFGRRRPEDGKINWNWPGLKIYNLVRAVTEPFPGAFSLLPDGHKLIIWKIWPEGDSRGGEISGLVQREKDRIFVNSSDGRLRLLDVEVAGQRMTGEAIAQYFSETGVILT